MRPITGIKILGFRLGVIALWVYWITLFVGTHWPAGPPGVPRFNDKHLHFAAFFGLALLGCYVTQSPPENRRATAIRFLGVWIFATLYGAIDEATQAFSRGRTPDIMDFFADAAGAGVAVILYATIRFLWRTVRRRSG